MCCVFSIMCVFGLKFQVIPQGLLARVVLIFDKDALLGQQPILGTFIILSFFGYLCWIRSGDATQNALTTNRFRHVLAMFLYLLMLYESV